MTATVTTPGTSAPAAEPFEAARARLQRALERPDPAHDGGPALPGIEVVPLGAVNLLRPGADPHAARRPAATVHLTSRAVLIGPWGAGTAEAGAARADGTGPQRACGQCLAMRWQRLRTRSEREALEGGGSPAGAAAWPVLTDHALDAVRAACHAVLTRPAEPGALPRVTRVDLVTLAVATFPLLPDPLCPHCVGARPETAEDGLLRIGPSPVTPGGGQRVRTLDSYDLDAGALVNPVCGTLGSRTLLNPASTTTAPVSGSHFVRGYAGLNDVTWSGQANRHETSRKLACLEGLERYAGTHRRRGTTPVLASYRDLAAREGAAAVLHPGDCGFYSERTYREDPMVRPFDPAAEIPWLWGHSLRDDRPVLVPARLVHYSAGTHEDSFVFECSNGCASGGSATEAVLYGLLELIERDAFLLAWYGTPEPEGIDLDSCRSGSIRTMVDRAALLGYDVRAFDNRRDLPVPVVVTVATRRDGGPGALALAAAAGFGPEATVESALSEVLTYIPHLPYQVADRMDELTAMAADFNRVRQLKDHAQLYGLPEMTRHLRGFLDPLPARPPHEIYAGWEKTRPRTGDLLDDLHLVRDALAGAGFDVIAVDQTTPEQRRIGLHTVATIVPGLLPLDFGWQRQRAPHMPRLLGTLPPGTEPYPVPHPFP
ncbi:hypothetical protein GCM10009716_17710 [Streptomyces sodiiphilus]|uniref:YcaO domain-containing protein n=1 Tax=Streptomyces sodiiphilus TaxID=226217 RepID=A0ABN2P0E5_9ACTN